MGGLWVGVTCASPRIDSVCLLALLIKQYEVWALLLAHSPPCPAVTQPGRLTS